MTISENRACLENMLNSKEETFEGKTVSISGNGNVAIYAAEKAVQFGAKIATMSDSNDCVYYCDGEACAAVATAMMLQKLKKYKVTILMGEYTFTLECDIIRGITLIGKENLL